MKNANANIVQKFFVAVVLLVALPRNTSSISSYEIYKFRLAMSKKIARALMCLIVVMTAAVYAETQAFAAILHVQVPTHVWQLPGYAAVALFAVLIGEMLYGVFMCNPDAILTKRRKYA